MVQPAARIFDNSTLGIQQYWDQKPTAETTMRSEIWKVYLKRAILAIEGISIDKLLEPSTTECFAQRILARKIEK